ncbi:hypothetical protein JW890_07575 [candidate division WOR-3 bacterium]|nr:hypothetical protein [candidate division WOR-3 bacterium]
MSVRIISRAVLSLPEVKKALAESYLLILNGTTNAEIASLLTGGKIDPLFYTVGCIKDHRLSVSPSDKRIKPMIFYRGEKIDAEISDVLPKLSSKDILLKGANSIDHKGNAGILVGGDFGGSIGKIYGQVIAKGAKLIIPVSARKLVPSVKLASSVLNDGELDFCDGMKVRMFHLPGAQIISEPEALKILFNLDSFLLASGGYKDSSSDIILLAEGEKDSLISLDKERRDVYESFSAD